MLTRRAYVEILYQGHNIKTEMSDYSTSFEYCDPANKESDTISLSFNDPDQRWIGAWQPQKGDQLSAIIYKQHTDIEDDFYILDCGSFVLDDYSYSADSNGSSLTINAISNPLDNAIKSTERTKTWEHVTIKKIADDISKRYNLELVYDAPEIQLKSKQQDKQTDSEFLQDIADKYGLMLKIYKSKIIIFDLATYKKKDAVKILDKSQLISFSWNTTLTDTYTSAEIKYTDNVWNETHSVKVGDGKRILELNEKVDSVADATLIANAALEKANHEATTVSFSTMGCTDLVAGQCVQIVGFANLNGKYFINKKVDSLSGSGYTSSFECSKVEEVQNG